MALPTLTPEQRTIALERAREVRAARAQLLDDIRNGNTTIAEVLTAGKNGDAVAAKTRVRHVIGALPGYGPAKVSLVMTETGIDENRRVGGLSDKRREALTAALS